LCDPIRRVSSGIAVRLVAKLANRHTLLYISQKPEFSPNEDLRSEVETSSSEMELGHIL